MVLSLIQINDKYIKRLISNIKSSTFNIKLVFHILTYKFNNKQLFNHFGLR